ncbi:MAG: transporter substrate-binding domain-containing protein [Methyloversatilis sp.]|nr:transporter substrate-binding domain-containing protein [Methyloversatilis sp.]MBP6195007.1 transporter substrate-binding domain-containing protein [Methyloversatilis sp.]MBP9117783.1 transporter substrate-binding domain-containing protein [Methyloversatilis sp.]
MRTTFVLAAALIVATALTLLVMIGTDDSEVPGTTQPLRALYAIDPPFAFLDRTGRVTGVAPELLRVLSREAGLGEIEFVHSDFGQLLHDLAMGRGDIVVNGAFVSSELMQQVRFTTPFARVSAAMLVAAGNPRGLHSLEDVAVRPDTVLAVIDESVELARAERAGLSRSRIQRHGDTPGAVVAIIEGRADAFVLTDVSLRYMLANSGFTGIEMATPFVSTRQIGQPDRGDPAFVLRLQDEALARRLDQAITAFVPSDDYLELVMPFGVGAVNIPAAMPDTR